MRVQSSRRIPGPTWSRRHLLGGAAAAIAGLALPGLGHAQEVSPDGWPIIRARTGAGGPTLRIERGEELRVRLINDLAEPTALHWHGVRGPNAADGVPGLTQAPVEPGAGFDYRFTPPDAGTFWYHPPLTAGGQRLRGAAGALIVTESPPVAVDDDVMLFVDAMPATEGAIRAIPVRTNARLRLRIVNALGDAMLALRLDQHRPMVMAIDGEPAEPFAARDGRLVLAPGNRIDLFVDMSLAPGASAPLLAERPGGAATLARLVYDPAGPVRPLPPPDPAPLPANPLPERIELRNALRVELALDGGAAAPLGAKPLFSAKRGRTVSLALANRTALPHVVHVHGHSFRLLDSLDDGWKPFWLDTLAVPGQQTARIAFVADNPGKWMLDVRLLGQADGAPAVWFEVT
jgi:FtsP/CotA-like multicopper oxidase with cupredoxin domain